MVLNGKMRHVGDHHAFVWFFISAFTFCFGDKNQSHHDNLTPFWRHVVPQLYTSTKKQYFLQ